MLKESLGNDQTKVNQLVSDFKAWQAKGGGDDDHVVFGKDGGNRDEKHVRHVHLIPASNAGKLRKWRNAFRQKHSRKSNIYLIYAGESPAFGFLLIDVLHDLDPGAHGIWASTYKTTRSIWETMADAFLHFGTVPTEIPIPYATTNDS